MLFQVTALHFAYKRPHTTHHMSVMSQLIMQLSLNPDQQIDEITTADDVKSLLT